MDTVTPRQNFVNQALNELKTYIEFRAVQYATGQVFTKYPGVTPAKESYIREDGATFLVISLGGTIPTVVGGVTYHTPIKVYLLPDFPRSPPMVYLNPTKAMIVEHSHPHVRGDGKVSVPTLTTWGPTSSLVDVLRQMEQVFSTMPPLKSAPPGVVGGVTSFTAAASPPLMAGSGGVMVPRRDVPPPAVSMLSPRDDLTQRITAKLRGKITELYGFTAGALSEDAAMQAQLEARSKALTDAVARIEVEEKRWTTHAAELATYHHEALDWLTANEGKVVEDADALAVTTDVVSQQLMDAVAESNACQEAQYYLRKLLDRERITLEDYLKEVRKIARRQFAAKTMTYRLSAMLAHAV